MPSNVSEDSFSSGRYDDDEYDSAEALLRKEAHPPPHRRTLRVLYDRHGRFAVLQLVLICIYTAIFLLGNGISKSGEGENLDLVYSPARKAVHYERVRFNATLVIDSPYNGVPSPEVDAAWRDLLKNMNIAVPSSDLNQIGASSIAIPNEKDMYIAGLSVFHELHCLRRIRQYTWPEYYYPNMTAEEARLNRLHTDHCIDVLRQAILCRADTSLFTLQWSQAEPMPRADFSHEHTCVDWQAVFAWAGERRVSEEILKSLKHPIHGPAFPDGKGSWLGASEDHSQAVT